MDLEIGWILLGLPLAFAAGWLASRLDLRQLRIENRQAPKAYFRGLNYLLNEQQDKAIDAFIEAVQRDPDTSELHFALGNLFRRRGEYDRAVRVHEHLLSRADLSEADRQRAQHALALDFLKAGLLDRAEDALRKLEGTAHAEPARLALLAIYERSREWSHASAVAQSLQTDGPARFDNRLAHYLCEEAQAHQQAGDEGAPLDCLRRAIGTAPQVARPRLQLAALHRDAGRTHEAWSALQALAETCPQALPLAAPMIRAVGLAVGEEADARRLLEQANNESPSIDLVEALVQLDLQIGRAPAQAQQRYLDHLERQPSLIAAARWLAGQQDGPQAVAAPVCRAVEHASRPLSRYRCAACGFEAREHFWQCPGCQAWDSYPPRRLEEL